MPEQTSYRVWHDHEGDAESDPADFEVRMAPTPEQVVEYHVAACLDATGGDEFDDRWQVTAWARPESGGETREFEVYLHRVTTVGRVAPA